MGQTAEEESRMARELFPTRPKYCFECPDISYKHPPHSEKCFIPPIADMGWLKEMLDGCIETAKLVNRKIEEEEMGETKQKWYYLNYTCNNCGVVRSMGIPFGERAPAGGTCNRCGCASMRRNWPRERNIPPIVVKPWPDSAGTSGITVEGVITPP